MSAPLTVLGVELLPLSDFFGMDAWEHEYTDAAGGRRVLRVAVCPGGWQAQEEISSTEETVDGIRAHCQAWGSTLDEAVENLLAQRNELVRRLTGGAP